MRLNDICQDIFCINMISRPDRADHFKEQMKKHDFQATFAIGIDGNTVENPHNLRKGEIGLIESYSRIIRWAQSQELESCLVFEDDATMVDDFNEKLELIKKVPSDWDFTMLGSNQYFLGAGGWPPEQVSENVLKCYSAYCAHAILWKKHMYEPILRWLGEKREPIDVSFTRLQTHFNCYAIYPSICYQYDNPSSILGWQPDYNAQGIFTNQY